MSRLTEALPPVLRRGRRVTSLGVPSRTSLSPEHTWLVVRAPTTLNVMDARARQHLDELLRLSVEDRALIAAELEASLDGEASPEVVDKLWAEEIRRRVQRVREGRSTGRDARTVLAEIRAKLATKKR